MENSDNTRFVSNEKRLVGHPEDFSDEEIKALNESARVKIKRMPDSAENAARALRRLATYGISISEFIKKLPSR